MVKLCSGVSYDISDRQIAQLKNHLENAALEIGLKNCTELCAALLIILNEQLGDEDDDI